MATLQTNAKHFKTKLKNWFAPTTFVIFFAETDTHIHHEPITDIPHSILTTIIAPLNPTTKNHNLPTLMSTQSIPHYAAQSTPSQEALPAADPPP